MARFGASAAAKAPVRVWGGAERARTGATGFTTGGAGTAAGVTGEGAEGAATGGAAACGAALAVRGAGADARGAEAGGVAGPRATAELTVAAVVETDCAGALTAVVTALVVPVTLGGETAGA
jgi:hypothetical protein